MESLDPRVNRLPFFSTATEKKLPLDQFGTYEVFVRPKDGKPFQHEGIVHAPNLEMAYVLAKEAFTRRFTCTSLCVVETRHVFATPFSEGDESILDKYPNIEEPSPQKTSYEIYVLLKRGKQHVHSATVSASSAAGAIGLVKKQHEGKVVYNLWAIQTEEFRFTFESDSELWLTLPEKKFRDAGDYKGGEKLKVFLEKNKKN